jgi:AraC family transcriptional activator of pobA
MPKHKNTIPTLAADEVKQHGLHLVNFSQIIKTAATEVPHRDENYIFILQEKGKLNLELDFRKVTLKGSVVYFILPGQVHHFSAADGSVWALMVEPSLVKGIYKSILDQYLLLHDPVTITTQKKKKLTGCLTFLADEVRASSTDACQQHIKRGLVDVITGMITREYAGLETDHPQKESRNITITRQFKALLFQHYKSLLSGKKYTHSAVSIISYCLRPIFIC